QDNKALQAVTSHNLGQNFAKAFNVQYQTAAGGLEYVWNTSWGVSTRMIGGLIMTHSDDNGFVCPPKLAPVQVVIVPIWKSEEERSQVLGVGEKIRVELAQAGLRVVLDGRLDVKPGAKYCEWEAKAASPMVGSAARASARRRSSRPRAPRSACSPIPSSARPKRPRRACGAGVRAWRKRCGRKRTKALAVRRRPPRSGAADMQRLE